MLYKIILSLNRILFDLHLPNYAYPICISQFVSVTTRLGVDGSKVSVVYVRPYAQTCPYRKGYPGGVRGWQAKQGEGWYEAGQCAWEGCIQRQEYLRGESASSTVPTMCSDRITQNWYLC